jgi:hypothetical protein
MNRSVDLMNGSTTLFLIVVGAFFLSDFIGNDGEGQLPFLVIGLLLIAIGLFRIVYRLVKGKWFRLFGRDNADA